MLTRLEVNGFKNLVDFSVDFGPFTCITGPAGVGKSNFFDAIRFLSLLTEHTINEAALNIRGPASGASDFQELFFFGGRQRAERIEIAAEMIVRSNVQDDFGREALASSSFLRYEVSFRRGLSSDVGPASGLMLEREELRPIIEARATRHLKFPHSKNRFRDSVVYNSRHARTGFVSTLNDPETGAPGIVAHQDGGYPARGRPCPAYRAIRTMVGTEGTAATPTILAAKREMQGWRILSLEPEAMRRPDPLHQPAGLAPDGAHIPATLHRRMVNAQEQGSDLTTVLTPLTELISQIVPVSRIDVARDDAFGLLSVTWEEPSGLKIGLPSVSDGALRFLVLGLLSQSPEPPPLLCIENPEIGLQGTALDALNTILQRMAVDPQQVVGPDNPLRQIIVVSQSPSLLQMQQLQDLLLLQTSRDYTEGSSADGHVLRCHPHIGSWRCSNPSEGIDMSTLWSVPVPAQKMQIGFPAQFWTPK